MNDTQRDQWVDNDEGLYHIWKSSRESKRKWIRDHRELIDEVAQGVSSGEKRAHYLKYG